MDVLAVLTSLMKKADRDSVRLAAAIAVLEHGFGKPLAREEHGTLRTFEKRSREELERSVLEKGAKLGYIIQLPKRTGERSEQ